MTFTTSALLRRLFSWGAGGLALAATVARANIPGGGTGTGQNVTLTTNSTAFNLSNGIISIPVLRSSAEIHSINYTFNNGTGNQTLQLLSGGTDGGEFYWENGGFGGSAFTSSVVVDPAVGDANHTIGDYAEVDLVSTSTTTGNFDVHISMLRGSPGFYVTLILTHPAANPATSLGEMRTNIYSGSIFNWMSVDASRNRQMEVQSGATAVGVLNAPVEVSLWTNGFLQGQYEDKYKYSADWGQQRVWGWSSVTNSTAGFTGKNVGLWDVLASVESYSGGPMKRDLMSHIGTTILNMYQGSHYGGGTDTGMAAGEAWTKVYGPYFVYANNISPTITDPHVASQTLYNDALAQAVAENTAWPYSWFVNGNYTPASGRGTVTGQMHISDSLNPNASTSGLWVGVVQTPSSTVGSADFQLWMKPYQFWVKTDANGNFTIPDVIAGSNYTLYAFGPGSSGTYASKSPGNDAITLDVSSTPFTVVVTGGNTTALGNITWAPTHPYPTVFEIGYPDRTGGKFRHGDNWWRGDVGPSASVPSPIWTKYLEYPFDFPNGLNYVVGTSQWRTGWNFILPVVTSSTGTFNNPTSTIKFNLASTPSGTASLYTALSSDYSAAIIIGVNNVTLTTPTVTGTPTTSIPSTGYLASYQGSGSESDASIREGIHGMFSDERITFPASMLKQGTNTITYSIRQVGGSYFADHAMFDYVRLELQNYVPPAPAGVAAYANNNAVLLSWPVTPGATSYNILRSTTSGSGYTSLATGFIGPVCGSGPANATYVDSTAASGTPYYYVIQSVNPVGASANSPEGMATPDGSLTTSAPATPTGLAVSSIGNATINLSWTASAGANYYTVQRAPVVNDIGYYVFSTLSNTVTGTTFTDTTPTNGVPFVYTVTATNAFGTSANASVVNGTAEPTAPSTAPGSLTVNTVSGGNGTATLSWTAVPGAVGYVVQRSTSASGPFTYVMSVTETTYFDSGLSNNTAYYYIVTAMNSAGVSGNSTTVNGTTAPSPPTIKGAGNTSNVTLTWSTVSGAANYTIQRSTTTGNETTIASGVTGLTYTDTGRTNGATVFYVVDAVNSSGAASADSNEVAVTPMAVPAGFTAAGNSTGVVLNWSAVTLASNYTVKRGTATGGPYTTITSGTVTAPAVTLTDSTGTSGTQYFYVVAAANNTVDGTTSTSLSSNSTEATGTAVATPTGVSATAFSGNATLNWTAVTGATSYAVRRSTTSGSGYVTINSTVAGTPFVDSGLTNGTTYYYVVAAQAVNGLSANSTQVSATPQGIPGSVVATAGTGTVALTWSAAAGVSSYVVKRGTATGGPYTTLTSGASIAGYTDTAVVNGTPYFYVVAGLNSSGVGANSAEVSATPLAPPANLTATAGNGNITLTWSAAAGATAYTIKRATTSGAETVLATGVSTTNYKDTTAANGTQYFYTVTATNSNGASGSSSETNATPAGSPPSAPTNLVLTPGESNVTLNWSAASGAATYIVQRSDTTGTGYVTINGAVATTSYLDTGLTDGNTYYYVVAAQNPAGTSANSAEANTTLAQNITAWTAASFPGVTDANITGPAATPENDGVPNLLKYFYGLDPATPAPANNPPVTSTTGPTNTVLFTFRLAKSATGLAYSIQSSTDLLNWTDTGVTPTVLSDQGTYYIMQASVPLGANPSLYLRLKVTTP